ncbi:MAG TPA: YdcF family protein [Candidatus Bathyarchaeia archaeon]|nr:YdcF family protein [Candidatus Bathyarchaeia archaeon]
MIRSKTRRIWRKLAFSTACVGLVLIALLAGSIWTYSSVNQLEETDAAIVLGAAVWGDQPSPVLRERLHHAIWLYQQGYAKHLIFTGGRGEAQAYAEAEVAKNYALSQHVPEEDIFIETKSTITEENLQNALDIANAYGWKNFTIVSDPLHMKRSMMMAEDLGMKAYASPTPTTAYRSWRTTLPFFAREIFFSAGYIVTKPFR